MATSPASSAALKAYLDKRFTQFEERTCLLFCELATGRLNRETKEHNILLLHIRDLMDRVTTLEKEHSTSTRMPSPYFPEKPAA